MDDSKEYEVVSKKNLMPLLLFDLMKKANDALAGAIRDPPSCRIYRTYVQQIYVLLSDDIERLPSDEKASLVLPDESFTSDADIGVWQGLHLALWSLARRCNHVGMDEKQLDFDKLLDTLAGGVISGRG